MWKTAAGSTGRLLQLCLGYFVFYVVTGVAVKYFLGRAADGFPGMSGVEYLVYSTLGGTGLAVLVVLALGWWRLATARPVRIGPVSFPSELLWIVPSGICTAVVIPTTTLMYTLPISVMVAMVIMRGSVIVISRAVDAIQIRQGLLTKRVYPEENVAVLFAIAAVAVNVVGAGPGGFEFLRSRPALVILGAYIGAYSLRIWIMNWYKNTAGRGVPRDNRMFFGAEQIVSTITLALGAWVLFRWSDWFGASGETLARFRGAIADPLPHSGAAVLSGTAFGMVAFFSVFLFMFRGRTATFAGLVNRLTSLIAGTVSTLVFHWAYGGRFPRPRDWMSLGLILVAIVFLTRSERKRVAELAAEAAGNA